MPGKRLKRVIERGGAVRQLEGGREVGGGVTRFRRLCEQDKARVVLRMIFQMLKQDDAAINFRRALAGDRRAGDVASLDYLCDAADRVFREERANLRVCGKKAEALGERDRM